MIFDTRACTLGEGPLWHPQRNQLFWFDIVSCRLLSRTAEGPLAWTFPHMVSAAGWIDHDRLLVASEVALSIFDLATGQVTPVLDLEADLAANRSNDGRADPQGGFWIGTMGKRADKGAGAIYRFYQGKVRQLYPGITIPNAICFPPDGRTAHFADTVTGKVMRVALDAEGWPKAQPEVYLDLSAEGLNPDGAVVDASGLTWLAEWGASRVAAYAPDGTRVRSVAFDAPHTSCPALGTDGTLYCTTALQGMDATSRARHPQAGMTFATPAVARAQPEHQVLV